jgi:hypothetical protein
MRQLQLRIDQLYVRRAVAADLAVLGAAALPPGPRRKSMQMDRRPSMDRSGGGGGSAPEGGLARRSVDPAHRSATGLARTSVGPSGLGRSSVPLYASEQGFWPPAK